jgi:uncharacterized membrane protein YfcA
MLNPSSRRLPPAVYGTVHAGRIIVFVSDFVIHAIELATGVLVGLLAGLVGIGGGIVAVPILIELYAMQGVDGALRLPLAIGTAQASMIPAGVVAAWSHARFGSFDRSAFRMWAWCCLAGAAAGLLLVKLAGQTVLLGTFAAVAAGLAVRLMTNKDVAERPRAAATPIQAAAAGGVGLLAAALGIGAGTMGVPVMTMLGIGLRRAIGLGAALNVVVAVPAVVGFVALGHNIAGRPADAFGYVQIGTAVLIGLTAAAATPLGAWLSRRAPVPILRVLIAGCLLVIAGRMLFALIG